MSYFEEDSAIICAIKIRLIKIVIFNKIIYCISYLFSSKFHKWMHSLLKYGYGFESCMVPNNKTSGFEVNELTLRAQDTKN